MVEFLLGCLIGAVVLFLAMLPIILRWRSEHCAVCEALEETHSRMRYNQKQYTAALHELANSNFEVERLREEKLNAWDIPDGC